jgi:hypothetical protein
MHGKRPPNGAPEVGKMGTDWFIKVECPHPNEEINSREECVKACLGCPFFIWEEPVTVAGFMKSMCGVRVGNIGMAAARDYIGERLTGVPRFTKKEAGPSEKLATLEKIKAYTKQDGWRLQGFSQEEILERLERLIKFCKRAEEKGLTRTRTRGLIYPCLGYP